MKKFFIVLLGTFLILFNDISFTDSNAVIEAKKLDANVLIQDEIEVEEEVVEEPEEVVEPTETYTNNEYVEEDNTVYETYSINYGTYGRLYVSWYDVALYDYNVYQVSDSSLQQLVDNYDSAAFYASHNRLVIADHDTQGFNVLVYLSEGDTAYIKFSDGSSVGYRLIRKERGYNTGPDLVDTANNSFFNMDSDLIMYTCYDGGIMVTLWSLM